jgi:Xaa-Pro dipeptidase
LNPRGSPRGASMLTADGCRARVSRLLAAQPAGPLLLGDPLHLRYFANCYIDPFSLGADFGGFLKIDPDGKTTLYHDHRAPKSVEAAFADQRVPVKWYDGQSPGQGPRRMILRDVVELAGTGGRIHDAVNDPAAPKLYDVIATMRRAKDPDEIELLKRCMTVTNAGHAWSRANVQPGMTEMDVYAGILAECTKAAGHPVVVYGDFAVSPGSAKRGGMATTHVIQPGETLILDFSVVIQGYRSDFTNTLVVGAEATDEQRKLFDHCVAALAAGETVLKAGTPCQAVYDAVRGVFVAAGMEKAFPHHAGHGLGLSHPEPPYLVAHSTESLVAGDVVTLEPGLYVDGVGGVRVEHNYLVTAGGFERLSGHEIALR